MKLNNIYSNAKIIFILINVVKYTLLIALFGFGIEIYHGAPDLTKKLIPFIAALILLIISVAESKRFAFDFSVRKFLFKNRAIDDLINDNMSIESVTQKYMDKECHREIIKSNKEKEPKEEIKPIDKNMDSIIENYLKQCKVNGYYLSYSCIVMTVIICLSASRLLELPEINIFDLDMIIFAVIIIIISFITYIKSSKSICELVALHSAYIESTLAEAQMNKMKEDYVNLYTAYLALCKKYQEDCETNEGEQE